MRAKSPPDRFGISLGLFAAAAAAWGQPGSLDPSFVPQTAPALIVSQVALQPDGKVLYLSELPAIPSSPGTLGRLNSDGSVDTNFTVTTVANGLLHALALDAAGRIIVGGSLTDTGGHSRGWIMRLNEDGRIDSTFVPGSGPDGDVLAMAIQIDGRILIGGRFAAVNGTSRSGITRLNGDGSVDSSFDPGAGVYQAASNEVRAIKALPDGKILLAGAFTLFNGSNRNRVARLNSDGSLDLSFDPGGGPDQPVNTVAMQPDDRILLGGLFEAVDGISRRRIARLNSDGSLDMTFSPVPGISSGFIAPLSLGVDALALQPDGRVLVGGRFGYVNGVRRPGLARLKPNGALDYDFAVSAVSSFGGFSVQSIVVLTNGQVLVGGAFSTINNSDRYGLARLDGDGTNSAGRFELSSAVYRVSEAEGNLSVTVKRTGGTVGPATIRYETSDGTARAPGDYSGQSGTLSFDPGEREKTVAIPIINDNEAEDQGCCVSYVDVILDDFVHEEVFLIGLSFPADGAVLGNQSSALVVIEDDDTSFAFTSPDYRAGELDGRATPRVRRVGRTDDTGTVTCATTVGGSATAGADYVARSATLVFEPGETEKEFRVTLLEDELIEGDETVNVALSVPAGGATLASPANAVLTIEDRPGAVVSTWPGAVDTSFFPESWLGGIVTGLAEHSDGRIFVSGSFQSEGGVLRNLAWLQPDGSLDLSFSAPPSLSASAVALQPDGRALVAAGNFIGGQIVRLNVDGSLDGSFSPGSYAGGSVQSIKLQIDGKLIIIGDFTNVNGVARHWIARLNSDGTSDASFEPGAGPEGGVGPLAGLHTMALQDDGKLLIGGDFTDVAGTPRNGIARLRPDGSLDSSFNPGSAVGGVINAVAVKSNERVLIAGYSLTANGTTGPEITALNGDGSVDATFNPGSGTGGDAILSLALQDDGKVLLGGLFTTFNGVSRNRFARLNADGSVDVTFDPGTGADDTVEVVALQNKGGVLIGGSFRAVNDRPRVGIARLIGGDPPLSAPIIKQQPANLTVLEGADVSFRVVASSFPLPSFQWTFNEQPIVGSTNSSLSLISVTQRNAGTYSVVVSNALDSRTSSNATLTVLPAPTQPGAVDLAFRPGAGLVEQPGYRFLGLKTLAAQGDGKRVVGGAYSRSGQVDLETVARLNSDGSLDASFDLGTGVSGNVQALAVQPDAKVLIAGWFFEVNGERRATIARLNADGSVDGSFNPGSGAGYTIEDLAIQADGKIVIVGRFTSFNGVSRSGIARLNTDGSLDGDFDPGTGVDNFGPPYVASVTLQSDGRILLGGNFVSVAGQTRGRIARLNSNGSLDTTFNPSSGADNTVMKVAVQTDGKIVLGGYFRQVNGVARNSIARLNSDGNLDTSFDPGAGADGPVFALAVQSRGRVLMAGAFTNIDGVARPRIARLLSNGTLDASFDPGTGPDAEVTGLALESDGGVFIGGFFTNVDGRTRLGIVRLLNDGDAAGGRFEFSATRQTIPESAATNLLVHIRRTGGTNGQAVVNYGISGGTARAGADFSLPAGTLVFDDGDATEKTVELTVFDDTAAEGDETVDVWLANPIGGATLGPQAAAEITIGDDDTALELSAGTFEANEDFGSATVEVLRLGATNTMVKVTISTSDGTAHAGSDYVPGSTVLTFAPGETNKTFAIQILNETQPEADESIILTLSNPSPNAYLAETARAALTIFDDDRPGSLDAAFAATLRSLVFNYDPSVTAFAIQPDDRIVVSGRLITHTVTGLFTLARLLPNGQLDDGFGVRASQILVTALALQGDGSILAGSGSIFLFESPDGLIRLQPNGTQDLTYLPGLTVLSADTIQVQADGKAVIGGAFLTAENGTRFGIARFQTNGSVDLSFNQGSGLTNQFGWPQVLAIALDSLSTRLLIGGQFSGFDDVPRTSLARLNGDGSLDAGFNPVILGDGFGNTNYPARISALALQSDGRILVAGQFDFINGLARRGLARLNLDGTLDPTFDPGTGPAGEFGGFGTIQSLAIQPDQRILAAGKFITFGGRRRVAIVRLYDDGAVDPSFDAGLDAMAWIGLPVGYQVALQSDGHILLAGSGLSIRGQLLPGLIRLRGGDMLALRGIELQSGGAWRLRLNVPTGQMGIVESSTNLNDWSAVSSPMSAETFDFPAPPGDRQRYFRLRSP